MQLEDSAREGVRSRNKWLSTSLGILRFSHSGRFKLAHDLAAARPKGRLLDYGCGDGAFLGLSKGLFETATGIEVDPRWVAKNTERYASDPAFSFYHADEVAKLADGSFDTVFCMEVLEHCTPPVATRVIHALRRLVADDGRVIISVPIEIGPSLMLKQAYRAYAALRHHSDYAHRERYRADEMVKMVLAGSQTGITRPIIKEPCPDGSTIDYHGHKGFNWRTLRERLCEHFDVLETRFSPLPVVQSLLNSQAWFICAPKLIAP